MRYEQRTTPPAEAFERSDELWGPVPVSEIQPAEAIEPKPKDHYVVLDEIVEGLVRLVVTSWPHLDRTGRLSFSDEGHVPEDAYALGSLQQRVDALRAEHAQPLRPLRVGDTFLVRGRIADPAAWTLLFDVTGPAREEAKTALFRAAIPARADAVDTVDRAQEAFALEAPQETLSSEHRARAARSREQIADPVI